MMELQPFFYFGGRKVVNLHETRNKIPRPLVMKNEEASAMDELILRRAQKGDASAFEQLVTPYEQMIWRVCGRAKLGAGTLRCLRLCWRLPWNWSDAEQLGRCPKPHKGAPPLDPARGIPP